MPQGPAPHPPEHHHHHHLPRRGRGHLGAVMSRALARAFHTAVGPLGPECACGWPPLSLSGGQAVVDGPVHDTRPAREPRALSPCLSASLDGLAVFTLGGILAAGADTLSHAAATGPPACAV